MDKPDILITIRDADKRVIEARKRLEEANKSDLFIAQLAAASHLADVEKQVEEQILDLVERFQKEKARLKSLEEQKRREEQAERTRIEQEVLRRAIEKGTLF